MPGSLTCAGGDCSKEIPRWCSRDILEELVGEAALISSLAINTAVNHSTKAS
jgi:hypothetical protein